MAASKSETIVALATPVGRAALAVLRMSGALSYRIAVQATGGRELRPRVAYHRDYRNGNGELLDDVVITFFRGPKSYSGEDIVEISCHGNPIISQRIIDDIVKRGARYAEPGEFTQRAFLNGRMDLTQAEAVMDMINARSEEAAVAAGRQLRGGISASIQSISETLIAALARIEAYIDFPEEDLPEEDRELILQLLESAEGAIADLLSTARYRQLLRDGVRVAIVGEPNVGKSSLLNRLLGTNRALVSAEPGTTRDFIEEEVSVGAFNMRLIDTAGLNPTPSALEKLGMERGIEQAEGADLFLWVIDVSSPTLAEFPEALAKRLTPASTIVVFNKCDLVPTQSPTTPAASGLNGFEQVPISTYTGLGIARLREMLAERVQRLGGCRTGDAVGVSTRHVGGLTLAKENIALARAELVGCGRSELAASQVRAAINDLGTVVGRFDFERVLDEIFGSFCIGK